ncbi:UPF0563 protein C17orf95 [Pelomyxa schiedti]|nr:UPF0563 protein C17orf95 [Pelomyxa schiedti]
MKTRRKGGTRQREARRFRFSDDGMVVELSIFGSTAVPTRQSSDRGTGYEQLIWASGLVLADYIFTNRQQFEGKRVLELGAGAGLAGLTAASVGSNVTLTDANCSLCGENCNANASIFSVLPKVIQFEWGRFTEEVESLGGVDIIIGADTFYDNTDEYEDVIASVEFFLRKSPPSAFFLTAYQQRSQGRCIADLLQHWGLRAEPLPSHNLPCVVQAGLGVEIPVVGGYRSISSVSLIRISH